MNSFENHETLDFNVRTSRVDGTLFYGNLFTEPNACAHHADRSRQVLHGNANVPVENVGQAWHPMGSMAYNGARTQALRRCAHMTTRASKNVRFGCLAWQLARGHLHLLALVWALSLGNLGLTTSARNMCLASVRLGTLGDLHPVLRL